MRKLFYLTILLSLSTSAVTGQNRARQAKKAVENIDYAAEIEKNLRSYNVDAATDLLDRWEDRLGASGRDYPQAYESMRSRALTTKNLLERVEKIELIDTMLVDAADFFANYMLSPSTGDLLDASALPDEYASHNPSVVFIPQSGKEMLWAAPSATTGSRIVRSQILDDGTVTEPVPLDDAINGIGATDYPFIQDDGMTIYFAAKGDNSLGGYDIFMTRRGSDGEMMQPQNIGMPFNSPFNDYMMVIDDARNLGWWASDRSGIPGKVTIYVFRPSAVRVNHNPDNEYIVDLALLRAPLISGGLDALLTDKVSETEQEGPSFAMSMGNGKVYTSLSDFKQPAARKAMEELLMKEKELADLRTRLDSLRLNPGKNDKSRTAEITKTERQLEELTVNIKRLTNRVVSAENK